MCVSARQQVSRATELIVHPELLIVAPEGQPLLGEERPEVQPYLVAHQVLVTVIEHCMLLTSVQQALAARAALSEVYLDLTSCGGCQQHTLVLLDPTHLHWVCRAPGRAALAEGVWYMWYEVVTAEGCHGTDLIAAFNPGGMVPAMAAYVCSKAYSTLKSILSSPWAANSCGFLTVWATTYRMDW